METMEKVLPEDDAEILKQLASKQGILEKIPVLEELGDACAPLLDAV